MSTAGLQWKSPQCCARNHASGHVLRMRAKDQFRQLQAAIDYQRAGRYGDAIKACKRLLRDAPDNFDGIYLLAMLHAEQQDLAAAIAMFERAARLRPDFLDARYNLAVALSMAARHAEAAEHYKRIVEVHPRHLDARNNYAASLLTVGRAAEALAQYDQLIALNSASADAFNNRGMALERLRRYADALADYDRALSLRPNFPQALVNRGNALQSLRRSDDALASYRQAIALRQDFADAYGNIGNVHCNRGQYAEAIEAYDRALALQGGDCEARAMRLHCKMHLCEWSDFEAESAAVISCVRRGAPVYPFTVAAIPATPDDQLRCARQFSHSRYPASDKPLWRGEQYSHDRIRVAYVSADFRQHAVSSLFAGMFECHDRSRFETTAISIGPDDSSDMRRRLESAFEHFVDAASWTDTETAAYVRTAEIDILIDLAGVTAGARAGVLAQRPAPLQISYLGGTRAVEYIDYLVADETLIPERLRTCYGESIIYLPDCFQPVDDTRPVAATAPPRAELGLPENGFVFCCFNNSFKIVPAMLDSWARILKQVDGSVLWLREDKREAAANLRKEAEARGIAGDRLVFAQRMPSALDHLARHRAADLFLDTLPFNAHTTACDALWAGLPVLTLLGDSFVERVGASLLSGARLPEMIARSIEEYEALALELAANPAKLGAIKSKLADNRQRAPLFDTKSFTRQIESAYLQAYSRQQTGLPPGDIDAR